MITELHELKNQRKKYDTPRVYPLSGMGPEDHTCVSGSGDVGCGTGSCAVEDCTTNGAAAQVARPDFRRKIN